MDEAWLTYRQAGDKLGVSPQAVRQKAIRGRWPRTRGNDGQARVQIPEQPYRVRTPSGQAADVQLVDALKAHVETLRADLAASEARVAVAEARADKAIAALSELANQLGRLAEERPRPWWRRLMDNRRA
jgi:hypothetical protein